MGKLAARFATWQNFLRLLGLLGIAREAFAGAERPALLLLYGAMIGLPDILTHDKNRENGR